MPKCQNKNRLGFAQFKKISISIIFDYKNSQLVKISQSQTNKLSWLI